MCFARACNFPWHSLENDLACSPLLLDNCTANSAAHDQHELVGALVPNSAMAAPLLHSLDRRLALAVELQFDLVDSWEQPQELLGHWRVLA